MLSVYEWLKTIEMKKFVDDGIFLQKKIPLIICQKKNTFIARTIGSSLSISGVISSKHRLPWNVYTKKMEDNNSRPLVTGRTNNWSRHLHGGTGKTPGGLLKNSESQGRGKQSLRKRTERPVVNSTLAKTSEGWLSRIHSILVQIDRLQLPAVYCNRRVV